LPKAELLLLPAALFVRMALNAIDGMLAREHGMKSDPAPPQRTRRRCRMRPHLPLALVPGAGRLGRAVRRGGAGDGGRRADRPDARRAALRRADGQGDRALLVGAIGLALGLGVPAGAWVDWIFALAFALAVWTVVNRSARRSTDRLMFASLTPAIGYTIAGIYAVLILASLLVHVVGKRVPVLGSPELRRRVASWWVMATLFAVAILLDRIASLVFLGFVSFLALKEYLSLIPTRRADRRVLFAYLAIPVQYWWVGTEWYGMFISSSRSTCSCCCRRAWC
jgi:phosphatidylglycerophosphate synthase